MSNVLIIFSALFFMTNQPKLEFDFGKDKSGKDWMIINDGVMGGLSVSTAVLENNKIVFSGNISLENNGGFASLRSPFGVYDISNFKSVKIRYKSYGRTFSLMLEKSRYFYLPFFRHDFKSESDDWKEEEIKLSKFKEYRLSQWTGNYTNAQGLSDIFRIGIILFDKKEGPFRLEIDYIKFE